MNIFPFKDFGNEGEILECLKNGKITKSYSPKFRSFAFTLHYYSPKAYNYIRSVFGDHLPANSTIRSWHSSIDGSPGISMDAIRELKLMASNANSKGKCLLGALMMDEMSIHKAYQWDDNKHKVSGYADFGKSNQKNQNAEDESLAKEALVFFINGINEKFKTPVAYFLINKLSAKNKASITREVILAVSKTGIKISSMTFDGLKGNITVRRELGANFALDMPYIINPHTCDKIFLSWDAAHMEKLARNRLAHFKVLYNKHGGKIEWRYFESLVDFHQKMGCQLGNKLTKNHLQWFRKKMNVRMAVETLSLSVANAMEFLRDMGYKEFQGCDATVEYIKYVNNVFDALNSKKSGERNFKRPVSRDTKNEYFSFFDEAIDYISHLKIDPDGPSILKTDSKTAFFGFIQNMKNIKNMYYAYIETNVIAVLYTFALSQDHLELFFGRICFFLH